MNILFSLISIIIIYYVHNILIIHNNLYYSVPKYEVINYLYIILYTVPNNSYFNILNLDLN
jgi:hypothetical protein